MRPLSFRLTGVASAAAVMLALGGCSHYHIGIPIAPGLSLGLGASKDGSYSVGLNTGFGPLGAGVAVNNTGVVAGSAGLGVGVGVGPAGAGVGVSKAVVLHDPKAAPGTGPVVLPATASANVMATAVPIGGSMPVSVSSASASRALGTPANPIAP